MDLKPASPDLRAKDQATRYQRLRDLPRILKLWPDEVRQLSEVDQCWLVDRLAQVLRAERRRGLTRHWCYDLSRHAALLRAYRAEKEVLTGMLKPAKRPATSKGIAAADRLAINRLRALLSLPGAAGESGRNSLTIGSAVASQADPVSI